MYTSYSTQRHNIIQPKLQVLAWEQLKNSSCSSIWGHQQNVATWATSCSAWPHEKHKGKAHIDKRHQVSTKRYSLSLNGSNIAANHVNGGIPTPPPTDENRGLPSEASRKAVKSTHCFVKFSGCPTGVSRPKQSELQEQYPSSTPACPFGPSSVELLVLRSSP